MSLTINPNRLALCIALAEDNHRAGVLLERAVYWHRYATAKTKKYAGNWIANDSKFWMVETRLSPDQFSRSLKRLEDYGLIERTQFWWGGRNVLFMRPSAKVYSFLEAATTWPAANELLAKLETHPTEISSYADPTSAESLNSNVSKSAEPTSVNLPNSNYTETKHGNKQKSLTAASSAKPTYAGKKKNDSEKFPGGKNCKHVSLNGSGQDCEKAEPMIQSVAEMKEIWAASLKVHYGDLEPDLIPKQVGALGMMAQGLGLFCNAEGPANLQDDVADILDYGICHWKKWSPKQPKPDPQMFLGLLENIVNGWHTAGCPKSAKIDSALAAK